LTEIKYILIYNHKEASMISVNGRILYSVTFFILLMILVYVSKPGIMFKNNDTVKSFGCSKIDTIFSLGVFTTVSSILSFYIFCLIDMIFN
jgi:hypothetical protein